MTRTRGAVPTAALGTPVTRMPPLPIAPSRSRPSPLHEACR